MTDGDGPSPSDMADWADYDDARRWDRCRCGGDMPGRCPGPALCPMEQRTDEGEEADDGDADMTTDTNAEAVERLALDYEGDMPICAQNCGCSGVCRSRTPDACPCAHTAATLRALRAERDAAHLHWQASTAKWQKLHLAACAERDAAQAEVARLREVVTKAFSAINAAYAQAHAEQFGHDLTASKHDAAVYAWREQARAALAGEPQR